MTTAVMLQDSYGRLTALGLSRKAGCRSGSVGLGYLLCSSGPGPYLAKLACCSIRPGNPINIPFRHIRLEKRTLLQDNMRCQVLCPCSRIPCAKVSTVLQQEIVQASGAVERDRSRTRCSRLAADIGVAGPRRNIRSQEIRSTSIQLSMADINNQDGRSPADVTAYVRETLVVSMEACYSYRRRVCPGNHQIQGRQWRPRRSRHCEWYEAWQSASTLMFPNVRQTPKRYR